jgi:hypothetical protein
VSDTQRFAFKKHANESHRQGLLWTYSRSAGLADARAGAFEISGFALVREIRPGGGASPTQEWVRGYCVNTPFFRLCKNVDFWMYLLVDKIVAEAFTSEFIV